ncbi:MAG: protease family protein [Pseudonocardiales bacterium]|nr:protease family protein [Pseudonocardiales bacterium]
MHAIAPATAGPLTSFVRRRPLTSFFLWFFTVGQALAFVPVLVDVPYPQVFIDLSTVVGLLLPALAITRITGGPDALRTLLRSSFRWRVAPRWYVLALLVVPALAVALAFGLGGAPTGAPLWTALVPGFAVALLVTFVLNNWWEEVAWAGFVGVRLQERFGSTLKASLVAGPLFALQHVSGVVGNDPVTALVLLVALTVLVTPFRMLAGWTVNRTGSLVVVGLLHAAADAAGPGSGFGPGLLAHLYPDTALAGTVHIVALALIGLAVLAATRGRLGHRSTPLL